MIRIGSPAGRTILRLARLYPRTFTAINSPCITELQLIDQPRSVTCNYRSEAIGECYSRREDRRYSNAGKVVWNAKHVAFAAVGAAILTDEDKAQWFAASKTGDVKQVQRKIAAGYDVNVRHRLGWTALLSAVANERTDVVKLLLHNGAKVNAVDRFGSVYELAKRLKESPQALNEARDREFSPRFNNASSFRGFTPLHYAVLIDNSQLVQILLDNGANPRARSANGHMPIEYAHPDSIELFKLLRDGEANYDQRQRQLRARVPLETRLRGNLVGQDEAIRAVAAAVRRKESGWHSADRPLVFLFVGSSGIGKTELAKHIATYVHGEAEDDEESSDDEQTRLVSPRQLAQSRKQVGLERPGFVRIDLSEYGERHEVAKLIGAPPGYVGYEQGGQLTRKLAACPNAVVLLDEVEKAHPDVLNVLLALFDEGRITDSNGQTVHCREAIFVLTSNLAAREIAQYAASQRNCNKDSGNGRIVLSGEFRDRVVRPILSGHFKRDEFLGRIDEIVYFVPFSESQLADLVRSELEFWRSRAMAKHKLAVSWTEGVVELLKVGYDVHFGARSIKHEVERRLVSLIALAHERGVVLDGAAVQFDVAVGPDGAPALHLFVDKNGKLVDAFDEARAAVPTSSTSQSTLNGR